MHNSCFPTTPAPSTATIAAIIASICIATTPAPTIPTTRPNSSSEGGCGEGQATLCERCQCQVVAVK